jgi:hypothetical protein
MREHNVGGIITDKGKPKYLKNYPPHYNFVHHKSLMDCHGTEPGPLCQVASD